MVSWYQYQYLDVCMYLYVCLYRAFDTSTHHICELSMCLPYNGDLSAMISLVTMCSTDI